MSSLIVYSRFFYRGCVALVEALLGMTSLHSLDVSNNRIGEKGIEAARCSL